MTSSQHGPAHMQSETSFQDLDLDIFTLVLPFLDFWDSVHLFQVSTILYNTEFLWRTALNARLRLGPLWHHPNLKPDTLSFDELRQISQRSTSFVSNLASPTPTFRQLRLLSLDPSNQVLHFIAGAHMLVAYVDNHGVGPSKLMVWDTRSDMAASETVLPLRHHVLSGSWGFDVLDGKCMIGCILERQRNGGSDLSVFLLSMDLSDPTAGLHDMLHSPVVFPCTSEAKLEVRPKSLRVLFVESNVFVIGVSPLIMVAAAHVPLATIESVTLVELKCHPWASRSEGGSPFIIKTPAGPATQLWLPSPPPSSTELQLLDAVVSLNLTLHLVLCSGTTLFHVDAYFPEMSSVPALKPVADDLNYASVVNLYGHRSEVAQFLLASRRNSSCNCAVCSEDEAKLLSGAAFFRLYNGRHWKSVLSFSEHRPQVLELLEARDKSKPEKWVLCEYNPETGEETRVRELVVPPELWDTLPSPSARVLRDHDNELESGIPMAGRSATVKFHHLDYARWELYVQWKDSGIYVMSF